MSIKRSVIYSIGVLKIIFLRHISSRKHSDNFTNKQEESNTHAPPPPSPHTYSHRSQLSRGITFHCAGLALRGMNEDLQTHLQ